METFFANSIMFLSSTVGLWFIWGFLCALYIVFEKRNIMYFFELIVPIVPIIHFLIIKKSKKILIWFILIFFINSCFLYFIQPSITEEKIFAVKFKLNNQNYIIDQPELVSKIKWDIYKTQFIRKLGFEKKTSNNGDLIIVIKRSKITYHNYSLQKILNIIKNSHH